jgi:hypothetical protein
MELTDSTCPGPRPEVQCRLTSPLEYDGFRFVWTKNPDPAKLGQVITAVDGAKLTNEDLWNAAHGALYPDVFPGFGGIDLSCGDFLWLPGGTASAPASLDVASWSTELMRENSETRQTENMAVGGAYGLRFARAGDRELRLVSAEQWVGKDLASALKAFLVGDVVNLAVAEPAGGGYCQIAFKPNFYAGIGEAEALDAKLERRWVPVVEGAQSGRYDISKTLGFFRYNIENGAESQFQ